MAAELARELKLVPSFHEGCLGPAEQGIHDTAFACFTQV
jgi:hypothetical protein